MICIPKGKKTVLALDYAAFYTRKKPVHANNSVRVITFSNWNKKGKNMRKTFRMPSTVN